MDSRGLDRTDELPVADTPEDVAVLYSWANLHGAKYRDFSASRREYRAQLRHRAAEQVREQELKAQAEAEAAAVAADAAARQAQSAAQSLQSSPADSSRQQALREAGRASRIASAERVEAARRAEAAALAEAAARREEREIAEANVSAKRQAAQYADSEIRRRDTDVIRRHGVPGEMSDPYVPHPHLQTQPPPTERMYERPATQRSQSRATTDFSEAAESLNEYRQESFAPPAAPVQAEAPPAAEPEQTPMPRSTRSSALRRPQGYTPDDASGVRQIYRGPEFDESSPEQVAAEPTRQIVSVHRNVVIAAWTRRSRRIWDRRCAGIDIRRSWARWSPRESGLSPRGNASMPILSRAWLPAGGPRRTTAFLCRTSHHPELRR